jgi:mannan endo-1,4-beta-mannosidase
MNLIGARNGHFDDNGSRFKIVGANNYYAAFATHAMRRAVLDAAKKMGLSVLRCPAFLDAPWRGAYFQSWNPASNRPEVNIGENGLERLDHLIADAEQAGIRLILPLANYWPDFGGLDRYVEWFHATARDAFYTNPAIRGAYQSYVCQILTRKNTVTGRIYKDEPAVFAWELANEPRCNASEGRTILLEWVRDMSRWIKQNDPNHLLGVGDEGFFGKHGVDCNAFLNVTEIDFGTFHLYPQAWKQRDPLSFGLRWIEQHLAAGRSAGKPMLLEEYGMTVGGRRGLSSASERDDIYRAWLRVVLEQEGAGDLAWMIASTDDETGELYPDYDRFTFYCDADVPSIRAHALEMFSQTAVPNSAPTPAVTAIASAPQNVTRIAPAATLAPPTRAAIPPRSARKNKDVPDTR